MSKKTNSGLKVHVLFEHRQASGSEFTESTLLGIFANPKRACQEKRDKEEDLMALDFSDEAFEPDYVVYDIETYCVEDLA